MKSIVRIGSSGKRSGRVAGATEAELIALDSRVELIQALIPLGLEAVQELLQQEVTALAGARYQHGGGVPGYRQEYRSKESVMNRLLRQCREIGLGVIVVDQHPHLISSAALGNTYTTICLNQKDPTDINKAAGLCLIADEDKRWLSRLPVGQGVVKLQDRWREPFLVQFPLVDVAKGAVTDDVLSRYLHSKSTGSGVPREFSGARDRFGQVRLWDEPLDAHDLVFLEDVLAHPDDGVKARYQRLHWSMARGNRIKEKLTRAGWLEAQVVSLGQTRTVLLRITRTAGAALGFPLIQRRESLEHEYWKRFAAQHFAKKGYRVIVEAPRTGRAGGSVDVLAVGNGETVAVEVETGKSHVVENVRADLLAHYDRVVVVPTSRAVAAKVERQLARTGLISPRVVIPGSFHGPAFC